MDEPAAGDVGESRGVHWKSVEGEQVWAVVGRRRVRDIMNGRPVFAVVLLDSTCGLSEERDASAAAS